jgi:hypothetical protein
MAYTLQQRDVLRDALQAVSRLFEHSAPNAWLGIRKDYGELHRRLECADRDCANLETERDQRIAEAKEKMRAWRSVRRPEKQHWIMEAVGEGPCTMGEIVERVRSAHDDFDVYEPYLEPIVKEMVRLGNLEKISTGGRGSQPKWRYQLPAVSADAAGLERAFYGDDAAVA